jgi:hypothetical protein
MAGTGIGAEALDARVGRYLVSLLWVEVGSQLVSLVV